MSRFEPGTRVGTISRGDENKKVFIFGFGVYVGDEIPETAGGQMGEALRSIGRKNPKIQLDNGKVVWGCECWWGPEDVVKRKIATFGEVVTIDIDEARAKVAKPADD